MLGDAVSDDHWIERWGQRLSTARKVPTGTNGADPLVDAIGSASGPVVVIAHKDGVERLVSLVSAADEVAVRGALLVAPRGGQPMGERDEPLPFPSILVASRNDPDCDYDTAESMGARWGSQVMDAGQAGGIDHESGHGPWPEGLMVFARFIGSLDR